MPCYTANLMSVEFSADNVTLLAAALESLGWTMREGELTTAIYDSCLSLVGSLTHATKQIATTRPDDVNRLKREYSGQVLKQATAQKGWILRQTSATAGQIVRY